MAGGGACAFAALTACETPQQQAPVGLTDLTERPAERALRAYARRLYARFDRVLAPSESMRRELDGWGVRGVAVPLRDRHGSIEGYLADAGLPAEVLELLRARLLVP